MRGQERAQAGDESAGQLEQRVAEGAQEQAQRDAAAIEVAAPPGDEEDEGEGGDGLGGQAHEGPIEDEAGEVGRGSEEGRRDEDALARGRRPPSRARPRAALRGRARCP